MRGKGKDIDDTKDWPKANEKNKEFKKFKKQGCEDYELLGEIFNTTTATEKLQQLSTEDSLSPIEERRLEEEFLSGSIHVDLEGNSSEGEGSEKEAAKAKAERYKLSILDPYSIGICMELLEKMEWVSSRSYNKAIAKFISAEWRQIFVGMSEARRKDWVDSLDEF
ncbi:hypothetical protein V6N13_042438 [Hibiscus sabdariffa]